MPIFSTPSSCSRTSGRLTEPLVISASVRACPSVASSQATPSDCSACPD
jgi:hypothetical protein